MKQLTFTILFLFISLSLNAQKQSIKEYLFSSIFMDGELKATKEEKNTFVFNTNDKGEIYRYSGLGEEWVFTVIKELKEEYFDDYNNKYKVFEVEDEYNIPMILQLFDNPDKGLKLIFSAETMIQFYN